MKKKLDLVPKLIEARDLISDPDRWNRGWFAADKDGNPVHWIDESACKWCALGAINKVADMDTSPSWELENALTDHCDKDVPIHIGGPIPVDMSPIVSTNDFLGHAATIKMFNDTIEALSK